MTCSILNTDAEHCLRDFLRQEMESARKDMGLERMVRPSESPLSEKQILKDEKPSQDVEVEIYGAI